ncbi:GNAT family N-acetyltransferase [Streptomyces sp. NPDC006012]|uniref:GNAT family N-acetyltransferase n=1 Tax=Streptomyces sp. NPDC006012 TaxID=3364739 RepID=UPI0036A21BE2
MQFRTATPDDEASLADLWHTAFGAAPVLALWRCDPGRHDRTFVAAEDGRVLSAVHWLPRPVRSAAGTVERVGCAGSVATLPRARGRGLVRRLMTEAAEAMTAEGCAWSLLFTGTPEVYRSAGWETFPSPTWHGVLPAAVAAPGHPGVRAAAPDDLPRLMALRERFDRERPLTTVRTEEDWRCRIPHWYDDSCLTLVTEPAGGGDASEPGGFVVARLPAERAEVVEIALAGPAPATTAHALLAAVAARAQAAGRTEVVVRLPDIPAVRDAVHRLLPAAEAIAEYTGMARPLLAPRTAVRATVTAPGAVHWFGDSF